ncbi:hypothetical protein L218DRAFT_949898 [Marasmius fiardii PR-910]|nr:hypothetical protein L218DRAFT_949898 [Marasmius fiardii PR-910]
MSYTPLLTTIHVQQKMTWTLERERDRREATTTVLKTHTQKFLPNQCGRPTPITFDRANGGRPPESPFPIFVKLPVELYHSVTSHISDVDLESLALVDRDCQQLARTVQFTDVTLHFGMTSMGVLERLLEELKDDDEGGERARIGPCIRRVKVTEGCFEILPEQVEKYPVLFPLLFKSTCRSYENIQAAYYGGLSQLLERGLPNLQSVEWETRGTRSMMDLTLTCIRVIAGRLKAVRQLSLNLGYFMPRLPLSLNSWAFALETLVLDVDSADNPVVPDDADVDFGCGCFAVELLKCVSGSLKSLVWKDTGSHQHSFGASSKAFSKLRSVALDGIRVRDFTVLEALLGENTRVMSFKVDVESVTATSFLTERGHIPTLESFHWTTSNRSNQSVDDPTSSLLPFISANDQLLSIGASSPMSPSFVQEHLLPLLRNPNPSPFSTSIPSFDNLTSLHIVWSSTIIPETALRVIGSLTPLKCLWISAGTQFGWRTDWQIDHSLLVETLKPLVSLETLVFTRDSYKVQGHPLLDTSPERYYVNRVLPEQVVFADYLLKDEIKLLERFFGMTKDGSMPFEQARMLHNKLLKAAWERWHQCKMVDVVRESYMCVFPSLNRCFVGQYWVGIERRKEKCGAEALNEWWERI